MVLSPHPMVPRVERQHRLIEELRARAHRPLTADSLAERLGVSVRTVERDVADLLDAGVPIATQRGPGGGYAYIGLLAGSVEGAQGMGMVWVFPFVFVSSAFVPTASMPGWLRAYADHSPVTVMIDTLRAWFNGQEAGGLAVRSLAWAAGLTLVFMTLSVARFRRTSR